jgi:signal transduction histidine kinase
VASWSGLLLISVLVVGGIFYLHQLRPPGDVLVLTDARFAAADDLVPPEAETYSLSVTLPDDWRRRAPWGDVGWYRLDLDLQVAPNRLWAAYLPNLEMAPKVFLNGVMIGGYRADHPLPRLWSRPVYFTIPSGILRPGHNTFEVRLAANGHWGRLGEIYIGPDEFLRPYYEQRQYLRISALQVIAVVGLVVSLFIAALYVAHMESIYGWFALFGAAWTLENYFVLTVDVPIDNRLWDLFAYSLVGFIMVTGSIFTFRFLGIHAPRWERMLVGMALVGPAVLFVILLVDVDWFSQVSTRVWFVALLALMVYPLSLMARAVAGLRNMEVVALACCYVIIVALAMHDWVIVAGVGFRDEGLMMQFAAAPTFVTFGVILVRRFVLATRERDQYRSHLQSIVAAKTREVEIAGERFRELEVQRTLLAERERLMRDMHDGIGSQLIGVMSRLSWRNAREREISVELRKALDDLRMMIDSLDDIGDDLVSVLGLFRHRVQPQLDDAGLALHWQMADLPPVPNLGPERVLHLLRMMQEAVTNVIKHAGAKNLWIQTLPDAVIEGRRCIVVEVRDDGCGLPVPVREGRGFKNLRHRARSAELCLSIERACSGTLVHIGFPVEAGKSP